MSDSSSRLPAVISAIVALGVMGAVVAFGLANRGGGEENGSRLHTDPHGATPPIHTPTPRADMSGCTSIDPDSPPTIKFELPAGRYDYGRVKQDAQITAEVSFVNAGQGLLCVTKVGTGCGCLKVRFKNPGKKRFNPGERGVVVMVLDTTNREGPLEKSVEVFSNDPKSPLKSFRVRMDISQAVVAAPPSIHFGRHSRGSKAQALVLLKSPKDDPEWKITGVKGTRRTPSGAYVDYTYEAALVPDPRFRVWRVTIKHPGLDQDSGFRDGLVFSTTHPERREVLVRADIEIVPRIRTNPKRVPLGFVRPGAPRPPAEVWVIPGAPGVEFEITKVEVVPAAGRKGPPGFTATFEKDAKGWRVDVKYDGKPRKKGLLEAELVIHTTDAGMPIVRVPVSATIRG